MSDMLEQAIIDAEALKAAATKNAETLVLEKYSNQIRGAVESLLEQDDLGASLGLGGDTSTPAAGGEAPAAPAAPAMAAPAPPSSVMEHIPLATTAKNADEEIEIPLDKLFEEITKLSETMRFGGDEVFDEDLYENNLVELDDGLLEEDYFEEGYGMEEGFFDDDETEHGQFRSADGKPLPTSGHYVETDPYNSIRANLELQAEPDYYGREELEEYGMEEEYGVDEGYGMEEEYGTEEKMSEEQLFEELDEAFEASAQWAPTQRPAEFLEETLTVEVGNHLTKRGWAGLPEGELRLAEEELLALEQDSKYREAQEAKRKAVRELNAVNESITKRNEKLVTTLNKSSKYMTRLSDTLLVLEEKLEKSNLAKAKLLFQNKALTSDSLNERQKQKLAEAVSNAETIEEAKVIFETLQNTVGSTSHKTQPNSLSEAIQKSSSVILSARKENSGGQKANPTLNRWKFLAGIDKPINS